jgi:uncharacterized membrane protein
MFNIPLHVLLVHFPIALTVMAAVYDLRAHFGKRPDLLPIGNALSLWAAAGAAIAMLTGLQLLGDRNLAGKATLHAALGLMTGLLLIAAAMARYSAQTRESGENSESKLEPWLVLEVLAVVVVIVTAMTGHRLALGV